VLGERPHQPERDHLVGEAGAPVSTLGYPELHVEPEQVLLDRGLGHDQVARDLLRRGRRDERLIGERRPTQRYQYVELASRQFRGRGAAQLRLGRELLLRQSLDPAAGGAECEDVTVVKHSAGDGPPVHSRAVT
jgi:hypothetical protein